MKCSGSNRSFCRFFPHGRPSKGHPRFVISSHPQSPRVQIEPISSSEGIEGTKAGDCRTQRTNYNGHSPVATVKATKESHTAITSNPIPIAVEVIRADWEPSSPPSRAASPKATAAAPIMA
jgi:hypothetical protein